MRPQREDYVRVTTEQYGFTLEPAVEYRAGDSFDELATILENNIHIWLDVTAWVDRREPRPDAMAAAHRVADGIRQWWPDRAYFVEVWQHDERGFAQVFQPFGLPRNDQQQTVERFMHATDEWYRQR